MAPPISSKVTFIALNSEGNYPYGSWLGDPNNPECRVRCHILPSELLHINDSCNTAEKMALTLLDYLFNRETLACSNISGMGKHKKKQLDPLLIHGIKCHLSVHFNITEKDWSKIKQNIDSKCRSAFRRLKGLCVESTDASDSTRSDHSLNNTTTEKNDSMTQDSVPTCESDCIVLKEEVIL
ncbi:protein BANP-like isoform X2 [Uloborus diversus]|nr:protein BANP-like isoform X2 [Uloborus diversus]